jgi:hypothetical protein
MLALANWTCGGGNRPDFAILRAGFKTFIPDEGIIKEH